MISPQNARVTSYVSACPRHYIGPVGVSVLNYLVISCRIPLDEIHPIRYTFATENYIEPHGTSLGILLY